MSEVFDGVRKGDVVLAGLMTAIGAILMVENVVASGADAVGLDSQSWLLIPVFALATVPILWRRRGILAVAVLTAAALALHVLAFGWIIRCGAGIPLGLAIGYSAGRLVRGGQALLGVGLAIAVQILVLVKDTAAGLGVAPYVVAATVLAWGVGDGLQRRAERNEFVSGSTRVGASV